MYPERDVFHITEFAAFCQVVVEYFIRKGEFHAADVVFKGLKSVAAE